MNFSTKTIVITGATGGIGQAFAKVFAEQGARLLLVARDEMKLRRLIGQLNKINVDDSESHADNELEQSQEKYQWLSADLTRADERALLMLRATQMKANMLINNAGISQFERLNNITEDDVNMVIEINLMVPIWLTGAFLQEDQCHINEQNPKVVVNVGSALGSIGYPFYSSYCASKFGLRGFTESIQRELSQSIDDIYYFAPRATATAINSNSVNAMNKRLGNHIDEPLWVALALLEQLKTGSRRKNVGWPEKLFARINGLFPELVDKAIESKMHILRKFV